MGEPKLDLKSQEGFMILHNAIYEWSEAFAQSNQRLANFIMKQSEVCEKPGLADSKALLVSTMANQTYGEFQRYYKEKPRSEFEATCWLQKVFVMCRMFGSEVHVESSIKSRKVEAMIDSKSGLTFGELTAIDRIETEPGNYGSVVINPELHDQVSKAVSDGKPTFAVRLLCDSVKHGVLSPAINLVAMKTSQQIYLLGLMAMTQCVEAFLKRAEQALDLEI